MIGTLEFIFEGLIFLLITVYFGWINKQWQFIQIPTVTFGLIGVIFLYLQPESPRFLVGVKRYDEARKSLNRIAEVNGLGKGVAETFVFPKE